MTRTPIAVLAHRGWWLDQAAKNAFASFERALAAGHGIETDIRDHHGVLVISHDMPDARSPTLDVFLDLYARYPTRPTLALNIKADGLAAELEKQLRTRDVTNYFVFDMSVPDTLSYLARGLPVFARRSEYETGSLLDGEAAGLWLDSFTEPFVPAVTLAAALDGGHAVALVSPELHGKPHHEAWHAWRDTLRERASPLPVCMICTDLPDAAMHFFNGDDQ